MMPEPFCLAAALVIIPLIGAAQMDQAEEPPALVPELEKALRQFGRRFNAP